MPQGSILGPVLFNIFINSLYLSIKKSELHNFADDSTIASEEDTIKDLTEKLEKERKAAIDWFKNNEMIVNPDKFQVIILNINNKMSNKYFSNIREAKVTSVTTLLGIKIDNKLITNYHLKSTSPPSIERQAIN